MLPEAKRHDFDVAVKRGDIGWNAAPFTLHSYFCGMEDMIRAFYPSARLEKRYGKTVRWAKQTDVPGHTRFFPQVLARSGIRLLQIGANNGVRGVKATAAHSSASRTTARPASRRSGVSQARATATAAAGTR
jgi:hypothetical protein